MSAERLRNINDILLKSKDGKPIPTSVKTQFSSRMATYARTGALDGLEGKYELVLAEHVPQVHSSHVHDTSDGSRCRTCSNASADGTGPLSD